MDWINKKHYHKDEIKAFIANPDRVRHTSTKWSGVAIRDAGAVNKGQTDLPQVEEEEDDDENFDVLLKRVAIDGKLLLTQSRNVFKFVVCEDAIPSVLDWMYNNPAIGLQGRDKLTRKVYDGFLGITKQDVSDYLKSNQVHQLHSALHKKRINKPIVISKPGKYYQIDITYWTAYRTYNNNYQFLLTMVDLNSKYVMLTPLTNIRSETVAEALKHMIESLPFKPSIIQSDGGPEFKDAVDRMLTRLEIKHITSQSHNPQAQGAVERIQAFIKRMIRRYMTLKNTNRWINIIPAIQSNLNSTKHRVTAKEPNEVLIRGNDEDKETALAGIKKQANATLANQNKKFSKLAVGDWVRVSILELDANERALALKHHRKSGSAVNYSRALYKIVNVKAGNREMYRLQAEDGETLPGWYYRDRLLKSVAPHKQRNTSKEQSDDVKRVELEMNDELKRQADEKESRKTMLKATESADEKARRNRLQLEREAVLEQHKNQPIAGRLNRERKKPVRFGF